MIEQGTPEWRNERAGLITASMFSVAREKLKNGNRSSNAIKYARRLALERIGGVPIDDGFDSWAMKRGRELEPIAREKLAKRLGVQIDQAPFVKMDNIGASADGFIGIDQGVEIKCLINPDRILQVVCDNDMSEFMDQIQGGMLVTGRNMWHFCLYLPQLEREGRDLFHREIEVDERYVTALKADLDSFDMFVDEMVAKIRCNIPTYVEGNF